MKQEHFKSGLSWMFQEFVLKLKAEGKYSPTYRTNLHCFDNYLHANFSDKTNLEENMLQWLEQRDTETSSSCRTRTAVARSFFKYAFLKGWMEECVLVIPKRAESQLIPYIFSFEELDLFFKACDNFVIITFTSKRLCSILNRIQLPVFFRLLYSAGFRPCELKEIKMEDIDVEAGVFFIRKSKNRCERMVVVDESVVLMLKDYLNALKSVMGETVLLFPDSRGNQRDAGWQSIFFKKIWETISQEEARAYDFRHTHITINISSWTERSYEFDGRLVFLKKYVGHTNIQQTADYFQYTPMLIEKLKGAPAKRFKDLCPPPPTNIDD